MWIWVYDVRPYLRRKELKLSSSFHNILPVIEFTRAYKDAKKSNRVPKEFITFATLLFITVLSMIVCICLFFSSDSI